MIDPVIRHLEENFDAAVERFLELLRIPSVSTDPAFASEVRRAADWLRDELAALGFEVAIHDTPGHPILVAKHPGPVGGTGPRLLYYGHYDVQPPDPLELWDSPPFEPVIVEAKHGPRVVARGAVDDKGQVRTFLEAIRAWIAVHGAPPTAITILLEGEEETGSPSLAPFLKAHAERLKADVAIITDTNSWDIDTPAITTSLRGMVYVEVTLHGPSRDLHSGLYGGAVVNPINALSRILGELHDPDGKVQLVGFYDDVRELSNRERAALEDLKFDEKAFLGEIGLEGSTGEAGRSVLERVWTRPTCDVNGIWGGYTGVGSKTVIAAQASAKLSCRLVSDQDPERIQASIQEFFASRTPPGCHWDFTLMAAKPAHRVDTDNRYVRAALQGLAEVYGRPAVLMGSGGSIPVVGWIKEHLGLDAVMLGFGLDDDRIHSPNEKFELKCLRNGMLSHARVLGRLAAL